MPPCHTTFSVFAGLLPHEFRVGGRDYVLSYDTEEHCPPERMSLAKFGVLTKHGNGWKCCTCGSNKLNCPHKRASQAGLDTADFREYRFEAQLTKHLNDERTYRRLTCESQAQIPCDLQSHQAFSGAVLLQRCLKSQYAATGTWSTTDERK